MSTSVQPAPQTGAFDDLIPKGAGGTSQGGGAFDDLIPGADGGNVDENKSVLGQLAGREWAGARTLIHGALSIPAGIASLPALGAKALSYAPQGVPEAQIGQKVLGGIADAVEPVRAGLQGVADAIAPVAQPNEIGFAEHPKVGNAISAGLDLVGGAGGGAVTGGLLGRVSKLVGGAAPETRIAAAVSTGMGDLPVGAHAVTSTSMPADFAPELAGWARRQDPVAARIIESGLKQRAAQQYPAIASALQDATGENVNTLASDIPHQIASMKASATPFYDAAYKAPDITDPAFVQQFQALANTPGGKQAYATAERIAAAEGNPIPAIPKGNGQPKWVQQMAEVLGRDPSPEEMAAAQAHNPSLANQPSAPGIGVRTLDLFKRGLDDVIQQRGDATATLGRQEGRALQSRLTPLLQSADQLVPDYGTARSTASQGFGLDDAASQARKDFSSANAATQEEVAQRVGALPAPEKRIYVQAAIDQSLNNLEGIQGSATGRADLATKLWSSIGGRGKLTALIGDPQKADALGDAMENLAAQHETLRSVTGGSQTAEKLATDSRMGNLISNAATTMSAMHGNPVSMLKLLGKVAAKAGGAKDAAEARQIAPLLVSQGPDVLNALQSAAKQTAARAAGSRVPTLLGAGVGATGVENP